MEHRNRHVRVFSAKAGGLPEVAAFTMEVGLSAGLSRNVCLRLTLLVEELFTNTVAHGHGGDSEEPIWLSLDTEPGRVALTYEDTGPPYDPFAGIAVPDETVGVDDKAVGGLGVLLIAAMARNVEYRRTDGRNRISLEIPTAG